MHRNTGVAKELALTTDCQLLSPDFLSFHRHHRRTVKSPTSGDSFTTPIVLHTKCFERHLSEWSFLQSNNKMSLCTCWPQTLLWLELWQSKFSYSGDWGIRKLEKVDCTASGCNYITRNLSFGNLFLSYYLPCNQNTSPALLSHLVVYTGWIRSSRDPPRLFSTRQDPQFTLCTRSEKIYCPVVGSTVIDFSVAVRMFTHSTITPLHLTSGILRLQ